MPARLADSREQEPGAGGRRCAKDLAFWFKDPILHPKLGPPPKAPRKRITLADLPPACKNVLDAPAISRPAQR